MTSADDPKTKDLHSGIAGELEELTSHYNGLLAALQR
jgi:hypothetical protein